MCTRLIILFFVAAFFSFDAKSQNATIRVNIKNASTGKVEIINNDYSNAHVMFKERVAELPLVQGKGSEKFNLTRPIFISIDYDNDSLKRSFTYNIFLSPGDNLDFFADADQAGFGFKVTGKGRENNQPLVQQIKDNIDLQPYYNAKDSLPSRAFASILQQDSINRKALNDYLIRYRPSKNFIKYYSLFVQYFPLWAYVSFNGNQKFYAGGPYRRNKNKWQLLEDSLLKANSLNNSELLNIPGYVYFIPIFLTRIKERLWEESNGAPKKFFQEWYGTDEREGRKIFNDDMENDLRERIINKYFKGQVAEFLYATIFKDAMQEKQDNIPEIFERFKLKYPRSRYTAYIEPFVAQVKERKGHTLNDKMVLIENPDSLKSFEDVLKIVKGKTVLLDMWGTWCGPCREELLKNGDSIKTYFKDKALDYLYIANYDESNSGKWKQLIPYYNLTGINILAGKELTKDIMQKAKGEGYPTYIIIKKDGAYELSKAGYPMDRNILYEQLKNALND
ncbi:MAG: TlpA family protein disulfide reductase [Bacteroidetes bacterium]|nr:TlpA family protein disulfide reductase [Bacteroidota bacterium]